MEGFNYFRPLHLGKSVAGIFFIDMVVGERYSNMQNIPKGEDSQEVSRHPQARGGEHYKEEWVIRLRLL